MDNLTELIIVLIYLLLAGAFATVLFTAMAFNMKAGEIYRQRLARTLDGMRLGRMLDALGIDASEYLHKQPMKDVHEQMGACAGCVQTETCESQLDKEKVNADNIDYCPNDESLRDFQAQQQAQRDSDVKESPKV